MSRDGSSGGGEGDDVAPADERVRPASMPADPAERYNVLLAAYQKMKQRAVAFKSVAQSERAAVAALRDELAAKEAALRSATETNDRLREANQSLAQRLAATTETGASPEAAAQQSPLAAAVQQASPAGFVSGLLGLGKSAAEASKLRQETQSMQEELAAKNDKISWPPTRLHGRPPTKQTPHLTRCTQ